MGFQRTRRLWLLDRQTGAIAEDGRLDLGVWISRQLLNNIPAHRKAAEERLQGAGVTTDALWIEWFKHLAQTRSTRSCESLSRSRESKGMFIRHCLDAPHVLQKSLETIAKLEEQLELVSTAVDDAVADFHERVKRSRQIVSLAGRVPARSIKDLRDDEQTARSVLERIANARTALQGQIESLYAVLELPPELDVLGDIDRRFLHLMIQCRETKIAVREKALGTLFEMERMEQAVAGSNNPLG
jgi:hypothetical protein